MLDLRDHETEVSFGLQVASPVKFRDHRPCECGDTTFLIYRLTMWSMCHVTLWMGFPHPKSLPC